MPPVVAVIAAVGSALATVGTAIASVAYAAGLGSAFSILIGRAAIGFIASAAFSALGRALGVTPEQDAGSAIDQGRQVALKFDPAYPREIVVGESAVGGSLAYATVSGQNNKYLWRVIAFSDYEVELGTKVFADGEQLTFGGNIDTGLNPCTSHFLDDDGNPCLYVRIHQGTTTQIADADLIAAAGGEWTSDCRGRGIAYAIARFTYDANAFRNGEPRLFFVARGAACYDPRTATTAFTKNAALVAAQFARGWERNGVRIVGLGASSRDIPDDELSDAADICDDAIALAAGGTEPRYEINGVISGLETARTVLADMVMSMGGFHVDRGGEIVFLPGIARTPVHAMGRPLTDDDFLADEDLLYAADRPADEIVNTIHSTFVNPDDAWQEAPLPIYKDAAAITADGQRYPKTRRYRFVTSSTQGQRLNKMACTEGRYQGRANGSVGLWGLEYQPGDVEEWTSQQFGGDTKQFRIEQIDFRISNGGADGEPMARVTLGLVETGELIDDWSTSDEADVDGVIPSRPQQSLAITNFNVAATTRTLGGATMPELHLTWDAINSPTATRVEIQYRTASETTKRYTISEDATETETYVRNGVYPKQTYQARARLHTLDRHGPWTAWDTAATKTTNLATGSLSFEYAASGTVEVGAGYILKDSDASSGFNAQCYSVDGITGPCHASAKAVATNADIVFGLNTDPTTDAAETSIDYAWHLRSTGQVRIMENGSAGANLGAYAAGDTFSVSFNNSSVRYYWNGNLIKTLAVSVTSPLFFDSSLSTPGGRLNRVQFAAGALAADVLGFAATFSNSLRVDDTDIRKLSSATAGWNAQLYSVAGYTGGAYASGIAGPPATEGELAFGLNTDPTTDATEASIDYGWYLQSSGTALMRASGVTVGSGFTYADGDTFQISYDGEDMVWLHNGRVRRRTSVDITSKLYFDSSFYAAGSRLHDVGFFKGPAPGRALLGFDYEVTPGGIRIGRHSITAVGAGGAWDKQCYSLTGHRGGAHCSASPAVTNKAMAFGLNTDPSTDADYTSIDFAFRFTGSATYVVSEAGVSKTTAAAHSAGDTFAISYDGKVVRYFVNGVKVYQSRQTVSGALYFDSSFFNADGRLENVDFGKGGLGAANKVAPSQYETIDRANLIIDPHFDDPAYWSLGSIMTIDTSTNITTHCGAPQGVKFDLSAAAANTSYYAQTDDDDAWIPVEPNTWYRVRLLTRHLTGFTGQQSMAIIFMQQNKTTAALNNGVVSGTSYRTVAAASNANATIDGYVQAPSDARWARVRVRVLSSNTLPNAGSCYAGAPVFQKLSWGAGNAVVTSFGGYTNPANPLTAADVGATATITIAAFTLTFIDSNGLTKTVSYNAGSVTGRAFSTLYHVFVDDANFSGGTVTFITDTSTASYAGDARYLWIGTITTPANGGGGTSGTGGSPDRCVAADAFVHGLQEQCERRARDLRMGELIDMLAHDDGERFGGPGLVDSAELCWSRGVRLVTESNAKLTCSISTPITQPRKPGEEERTVRAGDALGALVAVQDGDGFRWERIVRVDGVGPIEVMRVHAGGATFGAGDEPDVRVFTHNYVKP
ncbi:MAG: phage tail protein [Hyphomonadaceae bacterium]|nr:phage tail protein [Hyphomonadaceae bacterium]